MFPLAIFLRGNDMVLGWGMSKQNLILIFSILSFIIVATLLFLTFQIKNQTNMLYYHMGSNKSRFDNSGLINPMACDRYAYDTRKMEGLYNTPYTSHLSNDQTKCYVLIAHSELSDEYGTIESVALYNAVTHENLAAYLGPIYGKPSMCGISVPPNYEVLTPCSSYAEFSKYVNRFMSK